MGDLLSRLSAALEGRYRVERELGQGGMAVVFLAEDRKHNRPVAIKVLKPGLALAIGPERFLREIETAAQLSHPNILPLHDSGEADGLLYFVMPYVEGESLRDRLAREERLSVEDAIKVTVEVADALGYAHSQGLIHRDIKPENILFQAGHAVVTDFGISRAISEAGGNRLTETGLALGTLAYMSPEQASGETELDARTDIYGLGCVLFEMLTGGIPYEGPNPQAILAKKLVGPVPPVRGAGATVPATVEEVVTKALVTDPTDRFQTADQFAGALTQANTEAAIAADAQRRIRTQRWRGFIASALTTVLILAGWWIAATVGGPAIQRLAVLPPTNVMNDPELAFFVEGAHAAIISEFQMAGMGVIARRSVLKYEGTRMPIRDIARELDLDAVLEVSVYRQGDSVGIRVSLVDGSTEESLWSRTYGGNVRNVLTLYRDLTRAVATEIQFPLSPETDARLATAQEVDPEAYDAFLKGMSHWRSLTPGDLDQALQYFEFARDIDPDYALAYSGIALVWGGRTQMGLVSVEEARPHFESAILRAVELGGTIPEVRYGLALTRGWWEWNWAESLAEFQLAIELNPKSPDSHAYYSHILLILHREEEAVEHIARALELDPFNLLFQTLYGMDLNFLDRYDEAEQVLLGILEVEPANPMALSTLRTTYHLMARHEEALEMWRASFSTRDDSEALGALERGYAEGGYSAALTEVAETFVGRSRTSHVPAWQIGTLFTRAGKQDEALTWLERAFEEHDSNMPYLSVDPIFDYMRSDPRFKEILRRMDLPD